MTKYKQMNPQGSNAAAKVLWESYGAQTNPFNSWHAAEVIAAMAIHAYLETTTTPPEVRRAYQEQVEGACRRIELAAASYPKGNPAGGLLREAVSTIRQYAVPVMDVTE